ncbi:hypothetical protein [Mycobacterium haemophilum]|uniref:hypothetical protein n=1 Tax=Mycobacterium haemophilum TaxID=29311 RepID=UPI00143BD3E8|nr:hypothetical protein [Mycobacterium haemophilum]
MTRPVRSAPVIGPETMFTSPTASRRMRSAFGEAVKIGQRVVIGHQSTQVDDPWCLLQGKTAPAPTPDQTRQK